MDEHKQALIHGRKAYKTLLGKPEAFCPKFFLWMRSLVNEELVQKVTPENIEMVDKSMITKAGREYESDLIYKVLIEPNHEAYFYILMELQPDKSMALRRLRSLRMLNYIVQFYQSLPKENLLAANAWPAVFPVVLYNGDRKWNAKTEIAQCIKNKWIPRKYIPKMSYYLIDISKVHNLADALVRSVVYAEQHSEDDTKENYLDNLEDLARSIVPSDLKQAFADWFTLISTMPKENIERIKHSLKERDGNMFFWRANLQRRHQRESVGERGKPREARACNYAKVLVNEAGQVLAASRA